MRGRRSDGSLTPDEQRTLELVVAGKTYKQIAALMAVRRQAVSQRISRARRRLGAITNEQAVVFFDRMHRD